MHAASDVGVAESSIKSLVSPLLADTCRGGRGEADFISSIMPNDVFRFMNPRNCLQAVSILLIFGIKKIFSNQHQTFIITTTFELKISFFTEGSRSVTTM